MEPVSEEESKSPAAELLCGAIGDGPWYIDISVKKPSSALVSIHYTLWAVSSILGHAWLDKTTR